MASRLIVLRQRVAAAIAAAFEAFSGKVAPVLDQRIAPFLAEGETAIDFVLLQRVMGRMVAASLKRLIAADKAHVDELTNDISARLRRDDLMAAVRQMLIDIRRIVLVLFGSERAVEIVAVDGPTAVEPELLWRQAEHTLGRLRDPDLQLPEASTQHLAFDRSGFAGDLESLVTNLRQSIDEVALDRKQTTPSLTAKQEAMKEHDLVIGGCGRILYGLYLLANRQDLARQIRLRLRSRNRRDPSSDSLEASTPGETAPAPATGDAASGGEPVTV